MNAEYPSVTDYNEVIFYKDSKEYYTKYLEMIKGAEKSIHLQTYIFEMDRFGIEVEQELLNAKMRGVEIYIIVDSIGSRDLPIEIEEKFKYVGINFYRFNILNFRSLVNFARRLHHKILLIDNLNAMVGGINVFYSFIGNNNISRLDFAVFLKGPVIAELSSYCQKIFNQVSRTNVFLEKKVEFNYHHDPGFKVGISINDNLNNRTQIAKQYARLIVGAKNEITIINSYFFPRRKLIKQLVAAVRRGVRVRLILAQYSDWKSYIYASEYIYDYLLKHGVVIYQWNKSILHGKLATVDGTWSTIGSFNLNFTSYQHNLELNIDIYSREFAIFLNNEIEELIATGCDHIEMNHFREKASLKTKILRLFYYYLLSVISNFSFEIVFRKNKRRISV